MENENNIRYLTLTGLVTQKDLGSITKRWYRVLDISQATFETGTEPYQVCLGYSHSGPVYGRSGERKIDTLKDLLDRVWAMKLVLPDDIARRYVNAICRNEHIISVEVSPNCSLFAMKDGNLYNKKKTKMVFECNQELIDKCAGYSDERFMNFPPRCLANEEAGFVDVRGALYQDNVLVSGAQCIGKVLQITDGTKVIGEDLELSKHVTKVVIPESVEKIMPRAFNGSWVNDISLPNSIKELGERCFCCCNFLYDIIIPDGIEIIPDGCFSGCQRLSEVILPSSIKQIGAKAFLWCQALSDINIPPSIKVIGSEAFYGCNISHVVITDTVEEIGESAFQGSSLQSITFSRSDIRIGENAFDDTYHLTEIHIPAGSLDYFKTAFPERLHEFLIEENN